jgi:hypothetical protein
VFELAGDAGERPQAYKAAGLFMLTKIDLLIAIWDGEHAAGIGGTAQIVERALADGIPVVRIDPANPNAMPMSWREAGSLPTAKADVPLNSRFRSADEAAIALVIRQILSSPPQRATCPS